MLCLHGVKWFQVLLSNMNTSISTKLKAFKYYNILITHSKIISNLTLTILFNMNQLFAQN